MLTAHHWLAFGVIGVAALAAAWGGSTYLRRTEPGATLGPHSVILPAARIGAHATVGPASLVMRGEEVPVGSRWIGNPIGPWAVEGAE